MSTLRVDSLADVAGNPSNFGIVGTARAWVNFNGTGTVAIRASLNVSSITDGGVGTYTLNFTTALADANYAALVSGISFTTANMSMAYLSSGSTSATVATLKTTTALQVQSGSASSGAVVDTGDISVAVYR